MVYTCNYTMTVTATSPSGESQEVVITDMRIGEVWVCSGQSNMRFQVRQVRNMSCRPGDIVNLCKGPGRRDGNREGGGLQ